MKRRGACKFISEVDAWIGPHRMHEPDPHDAGASPIGEIDLRAEGIGTVIWAVGYLHDFG